MTSHVTVFCPSVSCYALPGHPASKWGSTVNPSSITRRKWHFSSFCSVNSLWAAAKILETFLRQEGCSGFSLDTWIEFSLQLKPNLTGLTIFKWRLWADKKSWEYDLCWSAGSDPALGSGKWTQCFPQVKYSWQWQLPESFMTAAACLKLVPHRLASTGGSRSTSWAGLFWWLSNSD